jgi:hypothetical protein
LVEVINGVDDNGRHLLCGQSHVLMSTTKTITGLRAEPT